LLRFGRIKSFKQKQRKEGDREASISHLSLSSGSIRKVGRTISITGCPSIVELIKETANQNQNKKYETAAVKKLHF
jgi:hypothetical protein